MATHSSILALRIPRAEEPGGLQSTGLQKSRTRLSFELLHLVWDNSSVPGLLRCLRTLQVVNPDLSQQSLWFYRLMNRCSERDGDLSDVTQQVCSKTEA